MTLNLVHIPVDMQAFNRWAGERGLVRGGAFDPGFAFHILLSAMFGKAVLQPFRLFQSERRRSASLYAYSNRDADELKLSAATVAGPDCLAALRPEKLRSKPMPGLFEADQRLGFDVRVRPVRRLRRELRDPQSGKNLARGAEADVFRLLAMQRFPEGWSRAAASQNGCDRETAYRGWLAERMEGAAEIEECRLAAFRRSRAYRGDGPGPEGPDATLHGELRVVEPASFSHRLQGGVGRHKAFGYGMVLLRPPGRRPPLR